MLQELKSQHREIVRLTFEGYKTAEIAGMLSISDANVRQTRQDPLFKAALAMLQDKADNDVVDVRKRLVELNGKALDALEDCMDQDLSQSVKLSAAKDVLDRNGYAPKTAIDHTHLHITAQELEGIKARAKAISGCIIEDSDEPLSLEDGSIEMVE